MAKGEGLTDRSAFTEKNHTTEREWWKYLPGIVVKTLEDKGWTVEDFEKLDQESLEQFFAQLQSTETQPLPAGMVTGYENLSKEDAQKVIDGYAGKSNAIPSLQITLARLLFVLRWYGENRKPEHFPEADKKCIDDLAGIWDS